MNLFKKIISIFLMIPALLGIYSVDTNDTETAYLEHVSQVKYENSDGYLPQNVVRIKGEELKQHIKAIMQ